MTESEIAEFEERLEKAIDDDNDYLIIIICERLFQHSRKTRYEVQYARALKIHRRFDESQKLFKNFPYLRPFNKQINKHRSQFVLICHGNNNMCQA